MSSSSIGMSLPINPDTETNYDHSVNVLGVITSR
jgi:hypothetical protein